MQHYNYNINIRNPIAYWRAFHDSPQQIQLNDDINYFFNNNNLCNERITYLFHAINTNNYIFRYVTEYEPFHINFKLLKKNVIIDYFQKKLILKPNYFSIDEAKYMDINKFPFFTQLIVNNLKSIPSDLFLQMINTNHLDFVFLINNFQFYLNDCENRCKIKFIINTNMFEISYKFVEFPCHKWIDFDDPKCFAMKNNIIKTLSGNVSDAQLKWLNQIFNNVFNYEIFVKTAQQNKKLILDLKNYKLYRKVIWNPEEEDDWTVGSSVRGLNPLASEFKMVTSK